MIVSEIERGSLRNKQQNGRHFFDQGYQFDITHKEGRIHSNADALSRRCYTQEQDIAMIKDENNA